MEFDRYYKHQADLDSPAVEGQAVTDSNTFVASRAVYVGESGNLVVDMLTYENTNNSLTFMNVQSGTFLPIRITRVDQANSTANSIIVLY